MPDFLPGGGHYSAARKVGNLLFTAGQVPRDGDRNVIGTTIEEQTRATLAKVSALLEQFGATLEDVVKATIHLQDLNDAPGFNAAYAAHFPEAKPVRTLVGSDLNGVMVEIDVVAALPRRPGR